MSKKLIRGGAIAITALLLIPICNELIGSNSASAQQTQANQRQDSFEKSKKRAVSKKIRSGDLDTLGYKVMDGVVIVPEVRFEAGYDSNHDEFFPPADMDTAFGLVDGSVLFGYIQADQAITLTLKSAYKNLNDFARDDRWDAGANLDSYFRLSPTLEYSGGLFYLLDEISFSQSETYSSYSQLDYTTSQLIAFLKSESYKLRYLKDDVNLSNIILAQRPFFRDSSFNIEKTELSGGAIFRPNGLIGIYGSGGFALADYTDQPDQTQIDRDAEEFWLIAGLRINWSPYLRTEMGWRYNERDIEDRVIGNYDNNGFDAKIIWAPNALLAVTFEADTTLGEPSAAFARVADIQRYSITVNLQPTSRSQIDIIASNIVRQEIGSGGIEFREDIIAATYAYSLTSTGQFYVTALYERTEELLSFTEYDRFKIGIGYRTKFVRNPGEIGEDINLRDQILPGVRIIETRIGYSKLFLPDTNMVAVVDRDFRRTLFHRNNHNGEVDGARIDFRIPGFASITTSPELDRLRLGNRDLVFNFAGYYGRYESGQNSVCNSINLVNHCTFFNIIDPQPTIDNSTGPFGFFAINTRRNVDAWGLSLDTFLLNGLTDIDLLPQPMLLGSYHHHHRFRRSLRAGLAIKALQQETKLFAQETQVPDPVDYKEDLDTFYYGGFIGFDGLLEIGRGFNLKLNADAGVYYANTNYKGNYIAYIDLGGGTYVLDRGRARLSDHDVSFIGSLRLELNKQVRWGTVGLFAEGEYYSHVPQVLYNDTDIAGGGVFHIFDVIGPQNGTGLSDDDAYSLTIGARTTIPLN